MKCIVKDLGYFSNLEHFGMKELFGSISKTVIKQLSAKLKRQPAGFPHRSLGGGTIIYACQQSLLSMSSRLRMASSSTSLTDLNHTRF